MQKEIQIKSKIIIPILICIFSIGCKKEKMKIVHDLISKGCIPQKIVLDEPLLGGYEDNYVYENDKLVRYGNNTIEYDDGLVSRISLGSNRYEEYFYNEQFQVIQSIQFRQDDPTEGFKVVDEKEYKYNGNHIVEIIDIDDNETESISYYANTNNIDSIKTFNGELELIELKVFQYDQFNNPQKNLLIPRFNYSWWIERGSENNISQKKLIKLKNQADTIIYNYDFRYNDYDFPIEISMMQVNSSLTTNMTINYIMCQ